MDAEKIEKGFRLLLEGVGEDLDRDGIRETPKRAARLFMQRNFGYVKDLQVMSSEKRNNTKDHGDTIPITIFPATTTGMLIRKVNFVSMCEHHMVDIKGTCWVGLIPGEKLMGMNKIDKVVKWYGAKLQIQENLTRQVADWLSNHIQPKGVIVLIKADHQCANLQGDEGHFTTSEVAGVFETNADAKHEFLKLIDVHTNG